MKGKTMRRIEIRGVIVSAEYDNYWFRDYIAKGCITPENRIRDQIKEAAAKKESIQLYINSNGGMVFAGSEMINAIKEFTASGGKLEIRVGAMAASMASAIVVLAGAQKVEAHKNAKLMFHSAVGLALCGPGAMQDVAKLLQDINNDVLSHLIALKPDQKEKFETWFADGREGWITAAEGKEIGLITNILGEDDTKPVGVSKQAAAALAKYDLDIAAFALEAETPKAEISAGVALSKYQELESRLKGLQAAKDAEIATLKKDFEAEQQSLTAQVSTLNSEITTLNQSLESAKTEMSTLQADHSALSATLIATDEQLQSSKNALAKLTGETLSRGETFASWQEAVSSQGYTKARKNHPDLYESFMASRS